MKDLSPEEKLLNLIKKKSRHRLHAGEEKSPDIPVPAEAVSYAVQKQSFMQIDNLLRLENIKTLNMILFFMLLAIIIYFAFDIFMLSDDGLQPVLDEKQPVVETDEIKYEPYSFYSKEFTGKRVFKLSTKEDAKRFDEPEVPIEELMANFSLLGIVSGENPQVIIEDKSANKTFFLRQGQTAGGLLLKKIEDGTITLIYKGEEFNLSL